MKITPTSCSSCNTSGGSLCLLEIFFWIAVDRTALIVGQVLFRLHMYFFHLGSYTWKRIPKDVQDMLNERYKVSKQG